MSSSISSGGKQTSPSRNGAKGSGILFPKGNYKKASRQRKAQRKRDDIEFSNLVCERAKVIADCYPAPFIQEKYRCFHCEKLFDRNEICADHFPVPKSILHSWERYDPKRAVPSCKLCNASNNPNRLRSLEKWKKQQQEGLNSKKCV